MAIIRSLLFLQIKLSSVQLARKYMKRVSSELDGLSGPEKEPNREFLVLQGVRFAFRVHQVRSQFSISIPSFPIIIHEMNNTAFSCICIWRVSVCRRLWLGEYEGIWRAKEQNSSTIRRRKTARAVILILFSILLKFLFVYSPYFVQLKSKQMSSMRNNTKLLTKKKIAEYFP